MTSMRLALVTRRFWPLVGGAERAMSNLATQLRQHGATVTILTAQWQTSWPTDVVHREIPVVRLPNPNHRIWGTMRYMMALSRWLRQHQQELDLVYVSMLKHDAYAAVGALQGLSVPVVLRAEGVGQTGDCHWQRTARFGQRIRRRCAQADALVAPSAAIVDELREAEYPPEIIYQIANGVAVAPPRDPTQRAAARVILGESNPDLCVDERTPVAVFTGRLDRAKGLFDLLRSWTIVRDRHPHARLWLVGEGPDRDDLYETILDLDLRYHVLMPGAFDDVQDVLHAADVYVLPSYQEGMSLGLLEAMAACVPVVATDVPGNRAVVESGRHGLLIPPRDPATLAAAICQLLSQPQRAATFAAEAYQRVTHEFSLDSMATSHLELFDELIARKTALT